LKHLIYLASPYLYRGNDKTDVQKIHIQEARYQQAIDATAYLMKKGRTVYSPIVATHPIAVKHDLPLGSEYWMQFDEIILRKCDEMYVLMIDGWEDSPGVTREIDIAKTMGMNRTYMEPIKDE